MFSNTEFWDELAVKAYKMLLQSKPHHALLHNNLGVAYMRMGKYNKAARSFQRAIKSKKDYAEAYYHLSSVYSLLGKADEQIRAFTKYQKLVEAGFGGVKVRKKNDLSSDLLAAQGEQST